MNANNSPQQVSAKTLKNRRRRANRRLKKSANNVPKQNMPNTNRLVSRHLPSMGKRGKQPGVLVNAAGGLAQLPDLTHTLTVSDRTFLSNFLDPCDERLGPSSGSKIPDGTLANSGINGFREAFNVSPPFPYNAGSGGPLGGPVWTLVIVRLPTIRSNIFLVAKDDGSDLTRAEQELFAEAVTSALIADFPDWIPLDNLPVATSHLKCSRVVWSQLRDIDRLNTLFNQVRITKFGLTSYHNAPDLYNQGMVMTAQWNCDNSSVVSREFRVQDAVVSTNQMSTTRSDVNVFTGGFVQLPNNRQIPMSELGGDLEVSTGQITPDILGFTGRVGFSESQMIGFDLNETVTVENIPLSLVQGSRVIRIINVRTGANRTISDSYVLPSGNNPIIQNLRWEALTSIVEAPSNDIELPPLDTQAIIQSTPKAVYLPMKEFNGAYNVGRAWEPVFEMQETDNQGPIRLKRRAGGSFPDTVGLDTSRLSDVIDLNFGVVVQVCTGLSLAASVAIKTVMDIEFVAGEGSPWMGFMNPNESVDTEVVALARAICLTQPFAYPQTYNSLGTLLEGVTSLLSHVPVIGNVVPLVSRFVKAITSTESNGPSLSNKACEIDKNSLAAVLQHIINNVSK